MSGACWEPVGSLFYRAKCHCVCIFVLPCYTIMSSLFCLSITAIPTICCHISIQHMHLTLPPTHTHKYTMLDTNMYPNMHTAPQLTFVFGDIYIPTCSYDHMHHGVQCTHPQYHVVRFTCKAPLHVHSMLSVDSCDVLPSLCLVHIVPMLPPLQVQWVHAAFIVACVHCHRVPQVGLWRAFDCP